MTANWAESNFAIIEQAMNGARGSSLHTDRKGSLSRFLEQGFPTPQHEEWRYSNLKELNDRDYGLPDRTVTVTREQISRFVTGDSQLVVFVNGAYSPALSTASTGKAVHVESLEGFFHGKRADGRISTYFNSTKTLHERSLIELNAALVQDGLAILVGPGEGDLRPIEILHVSTAGTGATVHTPRLLVVIEKLASVTVIERFASLAAAEKFNCAVSEVVLGAGAQCDYYTVIDESAQTVHYHSLQASIDRDAQFRSHLLPLGCRLARNEVNLNLLGSGSHSTINGLTALNGEQHVDNSTVMRHAVPHCESSQLFKGIYGGKSRGIFQGTIIVEKDAQKTNAFQSNQTLLLSREASVDTKPQLKIWADDVKCTHGATVGQLDDEALFYIKSRGVGADIAAGLLTEAFAGEVLSGIRVERLKSTIRERLFEKLGLPFQE